jgi:hypothetical protein
MHGAEEADLCAQWISAVAAERAAAGAVASNWLNGIGAVLSGFGLIALVVTINQGRKAAVENKRSADAAVESLAESRRVFLLSQNIDRAWIDISCDLLGIRVMDGYLQLHLKIEARNVGRMAATNVHVQRSVIFDKDMFDAVERQRLQMLATTFPTEGGVTLIPNKSTSVTMTSSAPLIKPPVYGDQIERIRPVVVACCRYRLPGSEEDKYSFSAWLIRKTPPNDFAPPNTIYRTLMGIKVTDLATLQLNDMVIRPVRQVAF